MPRSRDDEGLFRPFSINDTELNVWVERDRAHVELRNTNTDKTILEFWDDEVREAQEDGFIGPVDARGSNKGLHVEMYNLAHDRGLLSKKAVRA